MKLSLFIVATAVLAAVNVSALPAQQADNSVNANMNSLMKNAYPVGVELRKMIRSAVPKLAGKGVKGQPAAKAKMPQASKKVQEANSQLTESMHMSMATLEELSSDMSKYLADHISDARNVERLNILLNEDQPNPFSVLIILINLISKVEEDVKASIMAPLLPESESPQSMYGFTTAEVSAFENALKKVIAEAEGLMDEYKSVLEGKPVTNKFTTITFLDPVEVQKAANADATADLPKFKVSALPDVAWLTSWVEMVVGEAKTILQNVNKAVTAVSSVPDKTVHPDETKVEEPLLAVSDEFLDSFEDVPAAQPTHIKKRETFDDMDFPAPVDSHVHKKGHKGSPKSTHTSKMAKPSHSSVPSKMKTYAAVPTDVADFFSEFDGSDVEGPSPTGSL